MNDHYKFTDNVDCFKDFGKIPSYLKKMRQPQKEDIKGKSKFVEQKSMVNSSVMDHPINLIDICKSFDDLLSFTSTDGIVSCNNS